MRQWLQGWAVISGLWSACLHRQAKHCGPGRQQSMAGFPFRCVLEMIDIPACLRDQPLNACSRSCLVSARLADVLRVQP
jgi:hypothetical protein